MCIVNLQSPFTPIESRNESENFHLDLKIQGPPQPPAPPTHALGKAGKRVFCLRLKGLLVFDIFRG